MFRNYGVGVETMPKFCFCLARFSFARPRLCSRVVCLSVFPFPLLTHIHDTWHGRAGTCLFLLDFFGASTLAFLRISSFVELCLPYPELRFLAFCRIRFCMDGSYGFRTRKNFSVALFLVVSGRLVSGPAFLSISGISIFVCLSGIIFLIGRVRQNLLPKNFAVIRCLVFWSVGRLCGGCFAISRISIFAFLSGIFLMGRVRQNLLSENFAVIRCLVFCRFVVCAAVVLRYLVV